MKIKTQHIIMAVFLIGIGGLAFIGYKVPPNQLKSNQVSTITSVSVNNQEAIKLTQLEKDYWYNLEFTLTTTEYPGETPDYVIDLIGESTRYTAIYNDKSDLVFFSFEAEFKYGFLNSPPNGGWTKPLYKTKVTDELLDFLKIKNALQYYKGNNR